MLKSVYSFWRYRELVKNLVLMNLKLKYRDSVFGFLWSLANPLLLIVVYTLAFKYILRVGTPNFAFFLLVGILPWVFFANSLSIATGAIVDNGGLIKKVSFPLAVLPVASVLFAFSQYLLTLLVFLPTAFLFFKVTPSWTMVSFIPFVGLQLVFTIGLALLLSASTVFFRDVRHFVEILLMFLFWLTPIIYELASVPDFLRTVISLSPLAPFIVSYQEMFYYGTLPTVATGAMAGMYALVAVGLGYVVFEASAGRFAEEV